MTSNAVIIAFIAAIIVILGFFIWVFWTVAGMLMEITNVTKYGWPLQLVIFLIMWGISGGIGARCKS